jgi:predicted TIM-barrel enzyme
MTGDAPDITKVRQARELAGDTPILLGSGTTEQNIAAFMEVADGVIVGSSIKQDGEIANPVDVNRVRRFVAAARGGG